MSLIKSAVFVKGAVKPMEDAPFDLHKHIAFIGRSNVGKSTFLNTLTNQKNLARSSSKPGKTTEINFFLINNKKYFVDLPGYGYAKQPKDLREKIERMIAEYLFGGTMPIEKIVILVDGNIGPTSLDIGMVEGVLEVFPRDLILIIANKIDKVPKNYRKPTLDRITKLFPEVAILPFSSKEKNTVGAVLEALKL